MKTRAVSIAIALEVLQKSGLTAVKSLISHSDSNVRKAACLLLVEFASNPKGQQLLTAQNEFTPTKGLVSFNTMPGSIIELLQENASVLKQLRNIAPSSSHPKYWCFPDS